MRLLIIDEEIEGLEQRGILLKDGLNLKCYLPYCEVLKKLPCGNWSAAS